MLQSEFGNLAFAFVRDEPIRPMMMVMPDLVVFLDAFKVTFKLIVNTDLLGCGLYFSGFQPFPDVQIMFFLRLVRGNLSSPP